MIPTPAPVHSSLTYPCFPVVLIIPLIQMILQKYCIFTVMSFFWLDLFFCVFGFGLFWWVFFASSKFHIVVNKTDLLGKQNFKYFCGSTTALSTLTCSCEDCVDFWERDPPPKKPSIQNPSISEWLESLLCYPGEHSLLTDNLRYI